MLKHQLPHEKTSDIISQLIERCRRETIKHKKADILNQINSNLLEPDQIRVSSKLTKEEFELALRRVEENLSLV
jgi:hypothetical protein